MFFKNIIKKLWGFCIMGFVAGIFIAFVMPPVVIAVIEGILLGFLCVVMYCSK